jgi:aminoglycoside phosphotransferase (APT) family kinase protein
VETRKPGRKIGSGAQAKIYEWGDGKAVKLFGAGIPKFVIEHEYNITKFAYDNGVPSPAPDGLIEYNGQYGFVMEKISGKNMGQAFFSKPWTTDYYARVMADLHIKVNSVKVPGPVNSVRNEVTWWINGARIVPQNIKDAALRVMDRLPDGDSLCHMDLHPMNILISTRGPLLIDWSGGAKGDPMADVARTWLLNSFISAPWPVPEIFGAWFKHFFNVYLERYKTLADFNEDRYEQWKIPIAVGRFHHERIPRVKQQILGWLEEKVGR